MTKSLTIEDPRGMLSTLICLKFSCTGCGDPMDVALQCEGQGAQANEGAVIKIPCPGCRTNSQVIFTSDGTIHGLLRARTYERIPEPSLN
jgi:hypothetical protein